jgi:hypothetical protein
MVDKSCGKPEEYLPAKDLTDDKEDQDAGNANNGVGLTRRRDRPLIDRGRLSWAGYGKLPRPGDRPQGKQRTQPMKNLAKVRHPERWTKKVKADMGYAARILTKQGEVCPLFILHNRDGSCTALRTPLRDPEHRQRVYQFITATLISTDCPAFTLIMEAWQNEARMLPGESAAAALRPERDGPMPRDASDRIEVISISLVYRDAADERHSIGAVGTITRDAAGKPSISQWDTGAFADGAVLDIMPEEPATPQHREIATYLLASKGAAIMKALGVVEIAQ